MINDEGHNGQAESKGNHTIIGYSSCVAACDVNRPSSLGVQGVLQVDLVRRSQVR